jgi:hypothetical protein
MHPDKPTFRAPFFRDLHKTLLTVSSGALIAVVTFVQSLEQDLTSRSIFFTGFAFLVASIVLQLLIPLLNVISAGLYWNGEINQSEEDAHQAQFWGRTSGNILILSILSTIIGIVLLAFFAGHNI